MGLKVNEKTCIDRTTVLEWITIPSDDAPILHFLVEQESNHEPDVFYLLYNETNPNAISVLLNLTGWSTLRFRMRAVNSFGPSRPSLPTEAGICRTSQAGVFVFLCVNAAVKHRACIGDQFWVFVRQFPAQNSQVKERHYLCLKISERN